MKTYVLFIAFLVMISGQALAQHQGNNGWKHHKKTLKKERKWQKERDKKMAEYHRELRKKEREYYREMAKNEREYHKKLRERELEHRDYCDYCDHGFYHNDDYYYQDEVYYSRRTRTPIKVDAEFVFPNGYIQLRL